MTRPLRTEFEGAYYHVMNRGLGRRETFLDDGDHERFVDLLADTHIRWDVHVYAYCLMRNHYHVVLQTPRGNLSRVMRHVDGVYTQRFNRKKSRDGPLFRGRYRALLVEAESYLLQVVRYVHLNPVGAGLVRDPGAYAWSSHRLYRLRDRPSWLAWKEVLDRFKDLGAFERFVAEGNKSSLDEFYRRPRSSPFLGGSGFVMEVKKRLKRSREHTRSERTPEFPTLEAVARTVSAALRIEMKNLYDSHPGRLNVGRNLAIYVACRLAGFTSREIRDYFGLGVDASVTAACMRTEAMAQSDPRLRRLISEWGGVL